MRSPFHSLGLFRNGIAYALVATVGLAALFIIHIIYAFWLTMQNRKARGSERYAVTEDVYKRQLHINAMVVEADIPVNRMSALLFELEMKGVVKAMVGGVYHLLT